MSMPKIYFDEIPIDTNGNYDPLLRSLNRTVVETVTFNQKIIGIIPLDQDVESYHIESDSICKAGYAKVTFLGNSLLLENQKLGSVLSASHSLLNFYIIFENYVLPMTVRDSNLDETHFYITKYQLS